MRRASWSVVLVGALVLGGYSSSVWRGPLVEGWQVVTDAGTPTRPAAPDLATLLLGVCVVMLALASVWLLLAVATCAWDVLVHGTPRASSPSLLRPRLVQVCVAACLGATVLGSSGARAQSPAPDGERRHREVPVAATEVSQLDGLPVPDRTTGRVPARTAEATQPAGRRDRATSRVAVRRPETRRLEVRPGDSLWSLTAHLLPRDASVLDVVTGWRLLYAANRGVIGGDPDLLRPGQSLRVPPDLLDRTR